MTSKEHQERVLQNRAERALRREEQSRREALEAEEAAQPVGGDPRNRRTGAAARKKPLSSSRAPEGIESEVTIPQHRRELIEESEEEGWDEGIRSADQLLEIFEDLEEKNLFLIQQLQESEQTLDEKRHEYERLKGSTAREAEVLEKTLSEITERLGKTQEEIALLETVRESNSETALSEAEIQEIEDKARQLYRTVTQEEDTKASSIITQLGDLEKRLDGYLSVLPAYERIDKNFVEREEREIREGRKFRQREETLKEESLERKRKKQAQEEKNKKVFKKVGRPQMKRSEKRALKKKKEGGKQYTEEEKDMLDFVGLIIS